MKRRVLILIPIFLVFFACSSNTDEPLQGYIEGELVYLSSYVSGKLISLFVDRGQALQTGNKVFTLEPEPETDTEQAAQAQLAAAQADLRYSSLQLQRMRYLVVKKAVAKQMLDQAEADFANKAQQVNQLQATLTQTKWTLKQKITFSPLNGDIFDIYYRPGELVPANQPVVSVLAPLYIQVIFFLPERLLSKVHLGQTISFRCDSCPHKTLAKIIFISSEAEFTPPIIYSEKSRDQLVYRVRASMPLEIAKQFHPGQPVDIFLNAHE